MWELRMHLPLLTLSVQLHMANASSERSTDEPSWALKTYSVRPFHIAKASSAIAVEPGQRRLYAEG